MAEVTGHKEILWPAKTKHGLSSPGEKKVAHSSPRAKKESPVMKEAGNKEPAAGRGGGDEQTYLESKGRSTQPLPSRAGPLPPCLLIFLYF